MKFLYCPKCGIKRFQVKNHKGEFLIVQVNRDFELIPIDEGKSLEELNTEELSCLGCSWIGTKEELKKLPPI